MSLWSRRGLEVFGGGGVRGEGGAGGSLLAWFIFPFSIEVWGIGECAVALGRRSSGSEA